MLALGCSNDKNIDVGTWDFFLGQEIIWDKANTGYPKANGGPIHNQLNLSRWSGKQIWIQPLDPHQNQTDPHYTGGLTAMRQAQCYYQCLWIVKKQYAVTNTETDLGKYVFIFTIGFSTREQTSIQWDRMQR